MLADIAEVVFKDGGDGSTYVTLVFENETKHIFNPDIPYDGKAVYTDADGFTEPTYYDESGEEL